MKLFSLRENKLGMTLVEMVISLVILGILTTSTMGMIISSNNIFISTSKSSIDKQVGNYAFDFLESVFKYTTHMSIYDQAQATAGTDSQSVSLNITDSENNTGTIMFKGKDVDEPFELYNSSFYGGRTIQYSVHKVGNKNKHVKLKLTVFREGRAVYSRESVIKCLNLNLVAIGNGANPLVDKSSADAVNQFITFSVDEQLISGGKNAFSLEYKVADFLAKYNKIQTEYTGDLKNVYAKYINNKWNGMTDPGVMNTSNSPSGRIPLADYVTKRSAVTKAIFGDNGSATVNREGVDDITQWVNIHQYYQDKIEALLGFVPTHAGFTAVTPVQTGSLHGQPYLTCTGDEYYGVVATKEEMFLGFMLKYYDKNGDKKISKDEYPTFDDSSFFNGTSIKPNIDRNEGNKMVILGYFKDNVTGEDYVRNGTQVGIQEYKNYTTESTTEDVYTYSGTYISGVVYDSTTPVSISSTDSIKSKESEFNKSKIYTFFSDQSYSVKDTETNTTKSSAGGSSTVTLGGVKTKFYSGADLEQNILQGVFGASDITPDSVKVSENSLGSNVDWNTVPLIGSFKGAYYNNASSLSYVTNSDMAQGWYYIKIPYYVLSLNLTNLKNLNTRLAYVMFYVAANPDQINATYEGKPLNPNGTAIIANNNTNKTISFTVSSSGEQYYNVTSVNYRQVKYKGQQTTDGQEINSSMTVKDFKAHQYTDYVLYGVDWNSWFDTSKKGIVNRLISGFHGFVETILGRESNKNISEVTPATAHLSLGNRGKYDINNYGDVASYNLAWTVYNPKRGTWYYLPGESTRISGLLSSLSFSSRSDFPNPLDVDLEDGMWESSTKMVSDIETRKLSSSALFGLVNSTSDVLWVSLPTGNNLNRDEVAAG